MEELSNQSQSVINKVRLLDLLKGLSLCDHDNQQATLKLQKFLRDISFKFDVGLISWVNEPLSFDADNIQRKGIGLSENSCTIYSIFKNLSSSDGFLNILKKYYTNISIDDLETIQWSINLVLRVFEMDYYYLEIEQGGGTEDDINCYLDLYSNHYFYYVEYESKGYNHPGGDSSVIFSKYNRRAKGSGKQVLLEVLYRLLSRDFDVAKATNLIRSSFLITNSTSPESFINVSKLALIIQRKNNGEGFTKGIGIIPHNNSKEKFTTSEKLILSNIVSKVIYTREFRELVLENYPELTKESLEVLTYIIDLLMSLTLKST